jgi:hypothetical protein
MANRCVIDSLIDNRCRGCKHHCDVGFHFLTVETLLQQLEDSDAGALGGERHSQIMRDNKAVVIDLEIAADPDIP